MSAKTVLTQNYTTFVGPRAADGQMDVRTTAPVWLGALFHAWKALGTIGEECFEWENLPEDDTMAWLGIGITSGMENVE
jgi:hypothetical protein